MLNSSARLRYLLGMLHLTEQQHNAFTAEGGDVVLLNAPIAFACRYQVTSPATHLLAAAF